MTKGRSRRLSRIAAAALAGSLIAGCSQTYEKREASYRPVAVERPQAEIAEGQLLDVRIVGFEPGEIPADADAARGLSPEIRKAEGRFAATQLRTKMQQSGYWGAVRVVPDASPGAEVVVRGRILESDGELLRVEVSVADSTGARWFTREYEEVVDAAAYAESERKGEEPFGFLYTRISNDIALFRTEMAADRVRDIRRVAELRFAAEFAPDAFGGFLRTEEAAASEGGIAGFFAALTEAAVVTDGEGDAAAGAKAPPAVRDDGRYEIVRLPAEGDPMIERVRRLRARENLVVDALDQHYDSLSRRIRQPYTQWRVARLTEMNAIRDVEDLRDARMQRGIAMAVVGVLAGVAVGSSCRNCGTAGAVIGGVVAAEGIKTAIEASERAGADEKIHKAALVELSESLASDVTPIVVEVEGKTVELQGSADAKFAQWRDLMKQLYEREVGPVGPPPGRTADRSPGDRAAAPERSPRSPAG